MGSEGREGIQRRGTILSKGNSRKKKGDGEG